MTAHGAPTRRIVTVRRERPLRAGAAAIAIGFVLLVIGAVIVAGSQAVQVAAAKGRARVGNPITFDAKDADYVVTYIPDPVSRSFSEERVNQLACTETVADGTTKALDTAHVDVRAQSSVGVTAAEFRAIPGRTSITCEWSRSDFAGSYSVARTHKAVKVVGIATLTGGILVGLAGVVGVVIGLRGKPEVEDLSPQAR